MYTRILPLTALALAAGWLGCAKPAESASASEVNGCGHVYDAKADEALFHTLTGQQWYTSNHSRWATKHKLILSPNGDSSWNARSDVREPRPQGRWNFLRFAGEKDEGMICFEDGSFMEFSSDGESLAVGGVHFNARPHTEPVARKHKRADLPQVVPSETVQALTAHNWYFSHSLDSHRQPGQLQLRTDGTYTASYQGGDCVAHGHWRYFGRVSFMADFNICRSMQPEVDALPFVAQLDTVNAQIEQELANRNCSESDFKPQTHHSVQPVNTPSACTAQDHAVLLPLIRERTKLQKRLQPVQAHLGSAAPIFTDGGLLIGNAFFTAKPRGSHNHIVKRGVTPLDVDVSVVWRGDLKAGKKVQWEVALVRGEVKSHSPATDTLLGARLIWQPMNPGAGSFTNDGEAQLLWDGSLTRYDWIPNQVHSLPLPFEAPEGWGMLTLQLEYQYSGTERRTSDISWFTQITKS
jgi:hypothetical protein